MYPKSEAFPRARFAVTLGVYRPMHKHLISAAAAAALSLTPVAANATTFVFSGVGGAPVDEPTNGGNVAFDCGTVGSDLCTVNDAAGFDYSKDGFSFNARATEDGTFGEGGRFTRGGPSLLIQDIVDDNQGLGVISSTEGNPVGNSLDQINFDTGESILFSFSSLVILSDIFLNDGLSVDCPGGGAEGPCGMVGVIVDGGAIQSFNDFLAMGVLATAGGMVATFVGQTFEFVGLTSNAGYSIERLTVNEIPVPGAIPLLLSGIAGLGFASRRNKKKAA